MLAALWPSLNSLHVVITRKKIPYTGQVPQRYITREKSYMRRRAHTEELTREVTRAGGEYTWMTLNFFGKICIRT